METVLYADILFMVNFAMDFISLAASAALGARERSPAKISLASALGAVYAIAATVSGINTIPQYVLWAIVGGAMCIISFGYGSFVSFARQCIIFLGCSALLGGIMTAILSLGSSTNMPVIVISSVVVLFFIIKALRERAGCKSLKIKVCLNNKVATFEALCDSGNLLRDPFSGSPVILVSHKALYNILSQDIIDALLQCDTDKLTKASIRLRLIPYGNADNSGILCAFVPDNVTVSLGTRKARRPCLVAVSPHHTTYFAGFAATAPSVLIP